MKKMLKSLFLLTLACAMLCSVTALGETAEATAVDFSQYPESFSEWDANYLASYLRALDLFTTDGFVVPLSEGDAEAMEAAGGFIYTTTDASAMDMFFFFDAGKEELLASIRENQAIIPAGMEEAAMLMDGMIGNLVFSYSMGLDEAHMAALYNAMAELAAHFGLEPDFLLSPIME